MKVKAKSFGFFGNTKRKEGDIFEIETEKQFSAKWMEYVVEPAEEKQFVAENTQVKTKGTFKKAAKASVNELPEQGDVI